MFENPGSDVSELLHEMNRKLEDMAGGPGVSKELSNLPKVPPGDRMNVEDAAVQEDALIAKKRAQSRESSRRYRERQRAARQAENQDPGLTPMERKMPVSLLNSRGIRGNEPYSSFNAGHWDNRASVSYYIRDTSHGSAMWCRCEPSFQQKTRGAHQADFWPAAVPSDESGKGTAIDERGSAD
ncbi:hypothetical protein EJB05_29405, partial [Eragrostis curvula]